MKKLKVVAISDTHNRHNKITIPKCDILIHCGDSTGLGHRKEVVNFAQWFEEQPATHKIFVPGNHELDFEKQLPDSKLWFTEHCPSGILLMHEQVEVEGLKIFGTSYTPQFYNWAFMCERGEDIRKKWEVVPEGLDILISHGMPYGILDTVDAIDLDGIPFLHNAGCVDLRTEVRDRIKPKLFFGGHLHKSGGKSVTIGDTIFHNSAICNDEYEANNPLTIVEIMGQ